SSSMAISIRSRRLRSAARSRRWAGVSLSLDFGLLSGRARTLVVPRLGEGAIPCRISGLVDMVASGEPMHGRLPARLLYGGTSPVFVHVSCPQTSHWMRPPRTPLWRPYDKRCADVLASRESSLPTEAFSRVSLRDGAATP